MPLRPGARLGRYEILEPIGAGGMGEVYRARDEKLGREVAIKVLLDEFTADAERVRRFEREAKATAALNHPNLLAVYDVGTHEGLTFLVSELLQGRTLRDVLTSSPIPPRRAARYASQIAAGLAAAHAKGIVHRDLKPANLFVTQDDQVKILDFGLARVIPTSPADDGSSRSTETSLTAAGTILGSAGYMAPEQVRGAAIDHRADIFTLGCVLYEMLAGRRAFHRDSVAGTLAAIVESDPPTWSGDGTLASQRLMRIARRCLDKSPEQRFQSARDLAHVLADESTEESGAVNAPSPGRQPWKTIAMVAAAFAVAMTAFGVWAWRGARAGDRPEAAAVAFDIQLPADTRRLGGPVLSNDGQYIAFVGERNRTRALYLRTISDPEARLLSGTEGVTYPFFSPNGDRLAFFSQGSLKIMPLEGGPPSVLCQAPDPRGGAWGDDDLIVFAASPYTGLSRVSANGGTAEPLTTLGPDEESHRWPLAVPGAPGIVFVKQLRDGGSAIVSLANGEKTPVLLINNATSPRYARGWLFYVNADDGFLAAPFDAATLTQTAPGIPQPERFDVGFNLHDFAYSVSGAGTLAYVAFEAASRVLAVVEPGGRTRALPGSPRPFEAPRVSPAGEKIAVTIKPGTGWGDTWIGDDSGAFRRLTQDGRTRSTIWSPRGDEVAVESLRKGITGKVFIHSTNANSERLLVVEATGSVAPSSWLPDDTMMLYAYNMPDKPGIEELNFVRPGQPRATRVPLAASTPVYGRVSPDGTWLAYTTNESGQWEVYLTAFPAAGRVWPVSKAGSGREPVWAKPGRELFFLRADGTVMRVSIGPDGPMGDARSAGVGSFPINPGGPGNPNWDTMPGGRFIVAQTTANPRLMPISVVVNRAASLVAK